LHSPIEHFPEGITLRKMLWTSVVSNAGSALRSGERTRRHHAIKHFSAHLEQPADAYTDAYVAFRKKSRAKRIPRRLPASGEMLYSSVRQKHHAAAPHGKSRHRTNAL
jgi:hypothetical protein